MGYVSFNDVIELNGILKEKGLNFKIHLRDTCGRQSFWIEPFGNCACEGKYDEMYEKKIIAHNLKASWKHTLEERDFLWSMMIRR